MKNKYTKESVKFDRNKINNFNVFISAKSNIVFFENMNDDDMSYLGELNDNNIILYKIKYITGKTTWGKRLSLYIPGIVFKQTVKLGPADQPLKGTNKYYIYEIDSKNIKADKLDESIKYTDGSELYKANTFQISK